MLEIPFLDEIVKGKREDRLQERPAVFSCVRHSAQQLKSGPAARAGPAARRASIGPTLAADPSLPRAIFFLQPEGGPQTCIDLPHGCSREAADHMRHLLARDGRKIGRVDRRG